MNGEFYFGMKVSLDDEVGVIIKPSEEGSWGLEPGLIRWDTPNENDIEDWRGLYASFLQSGGTEIPANHKFSLIQDNGELKKYKGEYYYYVENSVDTLRSTYFNSPYVETEFLLSGNFLPPKKQIPFTNFTDRGIAFQMDGSCIYTWTSHCSDSPCSTTRQNKGEYKYLNDTIIVTYFLNRFLDNSMLPIEKNIIKTINDVEWRVIEPAVFKYQLSETKDTLFALNDSKYSQIGTKWIINDAINLLPTKPKRH